MDSAAATAGNYGARKPGPGVALVHGLALVSAAGVAAATAGSARWSTSPLVLIAVFTIVSGLTYVETGSTKVHVSGSFLGIMLAAVLLGGGPAASIGVVSMAIGWLRRREAM